MPKFKKKKSDRDSLEASQNKHTYFTDDNMTHVRRKPLYKMSAAERTWATTDTTEEFIRPVTQFDVYNVTVKNTPKEITKKVKDKKKKDKNQEECSNTSLSDHNSSTKINSQNDHDGSKENKSKKSKKKHKEAECSQDSSSSNTCDTLLVSNNNEDTVHKKKKSKKKKSEEAQTNDISSGKKSTKRKHKHHEDDLDMEEYGDIVNKVKNIICSEVTSKSGELNNQENAEEEISDVEAIEVIENDLESDVELIEGGCSSNESDVEIVDFNEDNDDSSENQNEDNLYFENDDLNAHNIKYNGNNMDYVFVSGIMVLKADGECLQKLKMLMCQGKISVSDYNEAVEFAVCNGNKLINPATKIVCINCKQYGHYSFGCTYDPAEDS